MDGYTVYRHPVRRDIFSDDVTYDDIQILQRGLHLSDARDFVSLNSPDSDPRYKLSYCSDESMDDFFRVVPLIF